MATVSRLLNGSTFSFGGSAIGDITGISYKNGGNWIEVTKPTDVNKLFELSLAELEVQIKYKTHAPATYGSKGAIVITWKDASTTTAPGTWMAGPWNWGGDWDNPTQGDQVFRPTVVDST